MGLRRKAVSPQSETSVLIERIHILEGQVRQLVQAGPSALQADNWEEAVAPFPWETMVHWPGAHVPATEWDPVVYWHPGRVDQLTGITVPAGWKSTRGYAVHAIKVVHDKKINRVEDGAFRYVIDKTLANRHIVHFRAFNGTPGAGTTTVQLRNVDRSLNVLSTPATIQSNEKSSFTGVDGVPDITGTPGDVNSRVHEDDMMWINVTAASGKGLGVYIIYA